MSKPIHYEQHPVTPERKRELVAAGFRIVDIRFKPTASEQDDEQYVANNDAPLAPKSKAKGKSKAEPTPEPEQTTAELHEDL